MTLTASQKLRRRQARNGPVNAQLPKGRSRNARRRRTRRQASVGVNPYLAAKMDPFSPLANGAKIPDANESASATFRALDAISISTSADGHVARAYVPLLKNHINTPASIASNGSITWTGGSSADVAGYATLAALYSGFRVVAGGIRITYAGNRDESKGMLYYGHVPNTGNAFSLASLPAAGNLIRSLPGGGVVALNSLVGRSMVIPFRTIDLDALDYKSCGETNPDGMSTIVIILTGSTASTAQLFVESLLLCEAVPNSNIDNTGIGTSPAAPYDPMLLAQGSNIQSNRTSQGTAFRRGYPGSLRGARGIPGPMPSIMESIGQAARVVGSFINPREALLPLGGMMNLAIADEL